MQILTGIDIVDCDRIKRIIDKYEIKFLQRYFTPKEQVSIYQYANNRSLFIQSIAARFAAKEALSKAFGVGLMGKKGLRLMDIEIIKLSNGKPIVVLYKTAKERYETLHIQAIDVSYSHLPAYAVAQVCCIVNEEEKRLA